MTPTDYRLITLDIEPAKLACCGKAATTGQMDVARGAMMKSKIRSCVVGAVLIAALQSSGAVAQQAQTPTAIPGGWQAQNVEPVSFIAVADRPRAFKLSMKRVGERWYLFVAGGTFTTSTSGFDVFDVTDPKAPKRVASVPVPDAMGQLTIGGNILMVSQASPLTPQASGEQMFAGVAPRVRSLATIFDISDPRRPKQISQWMTDGWGTHRNVYPGGRYAFMAAYQKGYKGQSSLAIVDMQNPAKPVEVGHWAQPGQRDGEPERPRPNGYHGPANVSADGKTLTLGYTPSLVNLDISDVTNPKLIGKLDFSPLPDVGAQAIHTALPLPGGMVYVSTEAHVPGCDKENFSFAAIVNNKDPAKPMLASYLPRPLPPAGASYKSFCEKEGRVGPHNVNGESHLPDLQKPGPLIYQTTFNAGLRIFDISNPYDPRETGWFLPTIGTWASGARGLEDVIVDTRGYAYASSGGERGVWIVRYTGPQPVLAPPK